MSFYATPTFRANTPPGYFDFSSLQTTYTGKVIAWFDKTSQRDADQINLMDSFFRLYLSRSYASATITRTPYIAYQLNQYGIAWFTGGDTQAAAILGLVQRAYSMSVASNILTLFNALTSSPLVWAVGYPQITYGSQVPAIYAEVFLIYSTAGAVPPTPPVTTYVERNWTAPTNWSKTASSATYYTFGYRSGANIQWMAPQAMPYNSTFYDVLNIAALPVAPALGSTADVWQDGTGDYGALYYYDGTAWRKVSSPNANQGIVAGGLIPTPEPSAVFAPDPGAGDPSTASETPPPASGPSQGYGIYAGLSSSTLKTKELDLTVVLTTDGVTNLGIIINLLRRIKPTLNRMRLSYTVQGSGAAAVAVEIKDTGAVS